MPVLSKRALEGLRTYQYKPAGYTVLDDWHQPFWNCAPHGYPWSLLAAPKTCDHALLVIASMRCSERTVAVPCLMC